VISRCGSAREAGAFTIFARSKSALADFDLVHYCTGY